MIRIFLEQPNELSVANCMSFNAALTLIAWLEKGASRGRFFGEQMIGAIKGENEKYGRVGARFHLDNAFFLQQVRQESRAKLSRLFFGFFISRAAVSSERIDLK